MRRLSSALLCLCLAALIAMSPARPPEEIVRRAWRDLPTTQNRCQNFDYFPQGGMQSFWCHLQELTTLPALSELASAPIFLSGPHSADALKLDSPSDFGHYNPVFVQRMTDLLIPAASDDAFRASTQNTYHTYVRPLARIYWLTRRKLNENPECMQRELKGYQAAIEQAKAAPPTDGFGYHEKWFFFMNPHFCKGNKPEEWYYNNGMDGGVSGNVVKGAVGFWLRRTMDGTFDEFSTGLEKLLRAYDPKWLAQPSKD